MWWQEVTPNVTFNMYRAPGKRSLKWKLIASGIPDKTYTDSGVKVGKTYRYYVTAVDDTGRESGPSNILQVKVQ